MLYVNTWPERWKLSIQDSKDENCRLGPQNSCILIPFLFLVFKKILH